MRNNKNILLTNEKGDACYINSPSSFSLSHSLHRQAHMHSLFYFLRFKYEKHKKTRTDSLFRNL